MVSLLDLVLKLGYLLGTLLVRVHFKLELSEAALALILRIFGATSLLQELVLILLELID